MDQEQTLMQIGVDSQRAVENRRIFIVAGDEITRAAVQFMLHDEYEAHEFGSFEDALRKAAEGPPDLLILDAQVLAADGSAVVDRARQAIPAAALLVVGGELQAGQAAGGSASGIGVIPLPLRVESVREAVTTALATGAAAAAGH